MSSTHPQSTRPGDSSAYSTPVRANWDLSDFTSADNHALHASFHLSLRALDDPTERKMFQEVLQRGRPTVSVFDVEAHYLPALHDTARQVAATRPADHWISDAGRTELCERLKKCAVDVSFACGLEVLGPIRLEIDSPSLAHQQSKAMHRALAEQEAAGRIEHFQRAVDLLRQLESQPGAAGPAVNKALDALNPADRGAMLKTLLLAGSAKSVSTAVCVVAGTSLIRCDLGTDAEPPCAPVAFELPTTLGPLRSVQTASISDHPHWLIGARDGVIAATANAGAIGQTFCYRDGGVESAQGFSRAIVQLGRIIACHGDAGLVTWDLGQPDRPAQIRRPAEIGGSPRNLLPLGASSILFSVESQLFCVTGDGPPETLTPPGPTKIAAVLPDGGRFIIAYDDGTLRAYERGTKSLITLEHRGRPITSAATLPWIGGQRLLLAGDDGAIDCVGAEDDLLTRYTSPHRGVRRIVASASHVAALSGDRTRVILWNAWDGKAPVREIALSRVTPHRIADLLLA